MRKKIEVTMLVLLMVMISAIVGAFIMEQYNLYPKIKEGLIYTFCSLAIISIVYCLFIYQPKVRMIQIGDTILWRGAFGKDEPLPAVITAIELCERKRYKYGQPVPAVSEELKDYCVFSLSNEHWAYGEQIRTIPELVEDYEYYYA